jgi:hypothetical protein
MKVSSMDKKFSKDIAILKNKSNGNTGNEKFHRSKPNQNKQWKASPIH